MRSTRHPATFAQVGSGQVARGDAKVIVHFNSPRTGHNLARLSQHDPPVAGIGVPGQRDAPGDAVPKRFWNYEQQIREVYSWVDRWPH